MSYLLAQILICLLIAGLIGFIIGWLWNRFKCKDTIRDNDESWNHKIGNLTNEHNDYVSLLSGRLNKSETDSKVLEQNLKTEISDTNGRWESKVHGLMGKENSNEQERESLEISLNKAKEDAKALEISLREKLSIANDTWESKVQGLAIQKGNSDKELDILKASLVKSEADAKALEADLNAKLKDSNSSWESKVQGLMGKEDDSAKELDGLKASLVKSEADAKGLKADLNAKLKDSNSSWESKVQGLMGQQDNSTKELELVTTALKKSKTIEGDLRREINGYEIDSKALKLKLGKNNSDWETKLQVLKNDKDKELDLVKVSLGQAEIDAKILESDLNVKLNSSSNGWKSRVQSLTSHQNESNKRLVLLKSSLDKSEANLKELESIGGNTNNEVDLLKVQVQNAEEINRSSKSIQDECAKRNLELSEKLETLESDFNEKMKTTNSDWESKVQGLTTQQSESNKELKALQSSLTKSESDAKSLKIEMDIKSDESSNIQGLMSTSTVSKKEEVKPTEVEKTTVEPIRELGKIDRKHKRRVKGMRKEKKTKRNDHQERETEVSETTTTSTVEVSTSTSKDLAKGTKDNLQLVKGIGKVLEKVLNDLGIYRFEQISSWTKEEAITIDKQISFPGRIEREEWIQQAKQLDAGEKTEFSERVKKGDVPTSKDK